jgi:hypothetical protein
MAEGTQLVRRITGADSGPLGARASSSALLAADCDPPRAMPSFRRRVRPQIQHQIVGSWWARIAARPEGLRRFQCPLPSISALVQAQIGLAHPERAVGELRQGWVCSASGCLPRFCWLFIGLGSGDPRERDSDLAILTSMIRIWPSSRATFRPRYPHEHDSGPAILLSVIRIGRS